MKTVAIIPAYNEVTRIENVVRGALKHVDTVLVIDDGSTDGTAEHAERAGAKVVSHKMNCGPGAATMTGIHAARCINADIVVTIDADGQHNPDDIPKLLKCVLDKNADLVIGSRFKNKDNSIPTVRRIFNMLGNIFTYMMTGKYVSDSQSGFKVFGPNAVKQLHLHLSGFEFCSEIIRESQQHRWKVEEIPIRVTYSEYTLAKGQSFSRGIITACKMLLRSFLR
jgi:polyprenyl-phospho-N-acetylgalactosaminyl synthase